MGRRDRRDFLDAGAQITGARSLPNARTQMEGARRFAEAKLLMAVLVCSGSNVHGYAVPGGDSLLVLRRVSLRAVRGRQNYIKNGGRACYLLSISFVLCGKR
jgi:hypothetical protein